MGAKASGMGAEAAPRWKREREGSWRRADGGRFAEVRQVEADRFAWWTEDSVSECAGSAGTVRDAMEAAERALGIREGADGRG